MRLKGRETFAANTSHKASARLYNSTILSGIRTAFTPERILFKVAALTYRAVNGSAPEYLSSYFTRVANVPSTLRLRLSNSNQLMVPSYNLTTVGKRAFQSSPPIFEIVFLRTLPQHRCSRFSGSV